MVPLTTISNDQTKIGYGSAAVHVDGEVNMAKQDRSDVPYEVGYRSPPRATQFKPGQSGNPSGRPKGSKNFATLIEMELSKRIDITENGKRRTITKKAGLVKQMINKAVGGDVRAIFRLLELSRAHESPNPVQPKAKNPYADIDLTKLSAKELADLYHEIVSQPCPRG